MPSSTWPTINNLRILCALFDFVVVVAYLGNVYLFKYFCLIGFLLLFLACFDFHYF